MSFINELKTEIQEYLKELVQYESVNYDEAWEIVNEASRKEIEMYEGTVCPLREEYNIVSDALDKIVHFNSTAQHIKELKTDEAIKKNYKKLLEIRAAVKKAFPDGIEVGKDQNAVVVATELLKKRKADLSQRQVYKYAELSDYMTEGERLIAARLGSDLKPIAFYNGAPLKKKYPNLLQLLIITTFRSDCAGFFPEFGNEYSVVFREKFSDLCLYINKSDISNGILCNIMFEILSNEYKLYQENEFIAYAKINLKNQGFVILRENFLADLLEVIEENGNFDLFDLAEYLQNKYGAKGVDDEYVQKTVKELKRLYRETPEQILVTEQRYYQQKQIEQMRENAERAREMMEIQAQIDAEEEEYLERRERKQAERDRKRMEEEKLDREWQDRTNRMKAEEKERREKREKARAEAQESYKKTMEEARRRGQQMHLCWKCANYGHGCHGGIVACGNFRPKGK